MSAALFAHPAGAAATHLAAAPPALLAAAQRSATTGQAVTFWVLAVLAVAAALGMIAARRAVHCALLLAIVMLSLAILYATQGAPFLAFVQVIVYTGAVLMLFLFVVMLIGVSSADSIVETIKGQRLAAGLAGIGLIVLLLGTIGHATLGGITKVGAAYGSANLTAVARLIFTKYVYAFEVTSALLITAALGAVVLAHRERTEPKPTQRDLARRRLASGHPAPLPGPGTYARHNAVDRPALLPDGRPSELSVSPAILGRRVAGAAGPVLRGRSAQVLEQGQRGRPEQPADSTARADARDPDESAERERIRQQALDAEAQAAEAPAADAQTGGEQAAGERAGGEDGEGARS